MDVCVSRISVSGSAMWLKFCRRCAKQKGKFLAEERICRKDVCS